MPEQEQIQEQVTQDEDGKFIINTDAPVVPEESAPPAGDASPASTSAPSEPAPTAGETPAADTGGFRRKEEPAPAEVPDWFKTAKESLGFEIDSVDALKARINAQPEVKEVNNELPDDYIKNAVSYYKEHGNLQPFLDAFSVKYEDMSHEQVMRHDLRSEYSDLSPSAFERLYKERVTDKYKLDAEEFDEETVEFGKELLSRDAEMKRGSLLEEQKGFIAPKKEDVQAKLDEDANKWRDAINGNPSTSAFLNSPQLELNVDGESFVYDVENPNDIVEMAIDNRNFWGLFADEQGQLDMSAFIEVAAFAKNREQYKNALIGLGKTLGTGDTEKTLKNGEMPKQAVTSPEGFTDWRDGFLSAAINQKK